MEFIDVSFIETSFHWLYIYQQFARASCIVHQLSEEVNTKGWCCFDEKGWMENLETSYLKKYALLLIKDFKKLCDFPDISASWSLLFKILHDNKYSWGEFEHPTAKTLKYDDLNQKILDENNQEINWYDIIYLSITPNAYEEVKHITGLRFSPHNYFCLVTSFNGKDLNQHL